MRMPKTAIPTTVVIAEENGQLGGKPFLVRNEALPKDENLPPERLEPFPLNRY
jgi:hypothetical protein